MNFFEGRVSGGHARAEGFDASAPASLDGRDVVVGVRPEDLVVDSDGRVDFLVDVVERLGFDCHAYGSVGGKSCVARLEGEHARTAVHGTSLKLRVKPERARFFDVVSGEALS